MNEDNDASSNPYAEEHLPVSGEFDAANIPQGNPLTTDEEREDNETANDMNKISAERTEAIEEAPDPDGPANPAATS